MVASWSIFMTSGALFRWSTNPPGFFCAEAVASLIYCTIPLWGTFLSVIFLNEKLGLQPLGTEMGTKRQDDVGPKFMADVGGVQFCFNVPSSENCIIIWIFRFQGLKPLINGTSMVLLLAVLFWHSGGSDSGYCTKHHFSKFGGWLWARVGAALFSGFIFPDIEGVAVGYRTPKKMSCSKYGNWTHIAFEGAFML